MPRAAVQYALGQCQGSFRHQLGGDRGARARARARRAAGAQKALTFDAGVRGGEPGLLRDFDTLARENGELGAGLGY